MVFEQTERASIHAGDETEGVPPVKWKSVRRSLPGLIVGEDALSSDEFGGRDCLSLGNSPQPLDELEGDGEEKQQQQQQQEEEDGGKGRGRGGAQEPSFRPPGLVRHESLPSLHLNARCLKCDAVGTIYCKGCEAHFCARHDQRRHRFLLRKNRHEHHAVPGISYFRIPRPDDDSSSPPLSEEDGGSENLEWVGSPGSAESPSAANVPPSFVGALRRDEVRLDISGGGGGGGGGGNGNGNGSGNGTIDTTNRGASGRNTGVSDRRRGSGGRGVGTAVARAPPQRQRSRSAIDLAKSGWYNKIVLAIVRPPRCKYTVADLGNELAPLGSGLAMKRRDFEVRNQRGLKLVCTQWRPAFTEDTSKLPCVVYLHGNSSARVDVVKTRALAVLGTAACTVVSFDFSGSGMSEGDWVTLGYFEQHDVADVLAYLRSNGMASRYLLWGRSMGAASALLYAARYPNSDLCGLILDSPFCSFRRLARDLVIEGQVNVPGFLVNGALGMLRRSVKKRTRCDLNTVAPIARARHIQCPCLFIAARKDTMVRPSHGADLSEAVGGASLFITCRGTHNSARPGVVLQAVGTFVKGCFQAPGVPVSIAFSTIQTALAEAQAMAAASRAGRPSSTSSNSGGKSTGAVQRLSRPSPLGVGVGSSDPGYRRPGGGGGADSSAPPRARPPAAPGPRLEGEPERRRVSSFTSEETSGARPSARSSLRDNHARRRSKSHAEDDSQSRRQRGGSSSGRHSRSGSSGDGSLVLEVGESEDLDLIADGGLGADGEVRVRAGVSKQRTWGAQKKRGKDDGGGSGGGVFVPKLQEHPYPRRRPDLRAPGVWEKPRGGTGELSPCPSTSPSALEEATPMMARGAAADAPSCGASRGGVAGVAGEAPSSPAPADAAASTRGGAVTRKVFAQGGTVAAARTAAGGKSRAAALSFSPLPPPPPPPSAGASLGAGTSLGYAMAAELVTGVSPGDPSSSGQDRPRPNGRVHGDGQGTRVPSNGGSGWVGRLRAKGPALTLLGRASRRGGKGKGARRARSFSRDRQSRGGGSGGDDAPETTTACTCGKAPSECLCYVGAVPETAAREQDRAGRPLQMRTASGKLKM